MASILVVCTGNICRSPMAEGFLRRELDARFPGGAPIVESAGTMGWEGSPAVPESVAAAIERGADVRNHEARRLEPELILPAALVVGMTTQHRDETKAMVPQAASRTFALKELARLVEALPPPQATIRFDEQLLRARVAEADALRRGGFAGNPQDEDIVDPLGMPVATFRAVAWEIDILCGRLVTGLFGVEAEVTQAKTRVVETER